MKRFIESIHVLGQVIDLMLGNNFTVPCDEAIAFCQYTHFEY